ncbi:protein preY, mitochondrial [Takifugu flavidus]|uniref:protein preY, mitochondrial n=1 Tax=Takifugu flavidus TaxID=433684 RepID=UPI002544736B|nr:protein preY, mitochondrial [Takifugu flavidus]
MFRNVFGRVLTVNNRILRYGIKVPFVERVPAALPSVRNFSDTKDEVPHSFDTSLLQFLVCPLSKKPLRYEPETNELINEELGIAYPITDGIPNMIPQEARLFQKDANTSTAPTQE